MGGLVAADGGAQSPSSQADAHSNGEKADDRKNLKKDFASIEQVGMAVLQVRICEDAMDEEQHCGGKDEVVETTPKRAANASSQERREEDQQQKIERGRACQIDEGL